jgi:hypothetical protein
MLTGLDILIARMKTNPEEFLKEDGQVPYQGEMFGGKWSDLLDYAWRVANEEERAALEVAQKEFYRDDFNERVFKRLAGEENIQLPETMRYKAQGRYATGWIDPRAQQAAQMHPLQNSAQNAVLQGGMYDPNTHGYLTTTSGFQAAEIKGEGQPIGYSGGQPPFWSGLFGGKK